MAKAGLPVCSPAKWMSYHFPGSHHQTPTSPTGWDNTNKRLGCSSSKWERIFPPNSPSCGVGGSQNPEPCAPTHKHHRHLELCSTTWAWQLLHRQHCWASEEELGDQYQPPGRAVPISFPLDCSQILSQSPFALVTPKGEPLILLVADLPLPLPTSVWRMTGGFTLHLKSLQISGASVKSCEEFLFPFSSLRSG